MANDKKGFMQSLTDFVNENPEAVNVGLGVLGSFQDDARRKGLAGDAIAKTQYGYLLGQGSGDISKAMNVPSTMDRVLRGLSRGQSQRRMNEFMKAVEDAKAEKKAPFRKPAAIKRPSETLEQATTGNINPAHPVTIGRDAETSPAKQMQQALGGVQDTAIPFRPVDNAQPQLPGFLQGIDPIGLMPTADMANRKQMVSKEDQAKAELLRLAASPRGY